MYLNAYFSTTYLILWIESFIETGEIEDIKDAETVYSRVNLSFLPITVIAIVSTGLMSDCV